MVDAGHHDVGPCELLTRLTERVVHGHDQRPAGLVHVVTVVAVGVAVGVVAGVVVHGGPPHCTTVTAYS